MALGGKEMVMRFLKWLSVLGVLGAGANSISRSAFDQGVEAGRYELALRLARSRGYQPFTLEQNGDDFTLDEIARAEALAEIGRAIDEYHFYPDQFEFEFDPAELYHYLHQANEGEWYEMLSQFRQDHRRALQRLCERVDALVKEKPVTGSP